MAELCSHVPGSPHSSTAAQAPSHWDVFEQTKPAFPFALFATGMIPQFSLRPAFPGAFPPSLDGDHTTCPAWQPHKQADFSIPAEQTLSGHGQDGNSGIFTA